MAQTTAERQAAYRARHLHDEGGTGERLNVVINLHAKRALERLASCYGVTQLAMLEQIIAAAEREALNMPIQGTQADILKLAMVGLAPQLKKELPDVRLILTVHDELVMEVPIAQKEAAAKLLQTCMLEVAVLNVPVAVTLKSGNNWADVEEFSL